MKISLRSTIAASAFLLHAITAQAQWVQTHGPYNGAISLIASGSTLIAVSGSGELFRTTDSGANWASVHGSSNFRGLAGSGTNLFAWSERGNVAISTNNGGTWQVNHNPAWGLTNVDVRALAVIGNDLSRTKYYLATADGVFQGNTSNIWGRIDTGLTNKNVQALALLLPVGTGGRGSVHLFAGTKSGGVFRRSDNGGWVAVNTGLANNDIRALAVSDTSLYAATAAGVFLSTDNGAHWSALNVGLTNMNIRTLVTSGTTVLVGTSNGGVFRLNGATWTPISTDLAYTDIRALAVAGSELYAGGVGNSVRRRP